MPHETLRAWLAHIPSWVFVVLAVASGVLALASALLVPVLLVRLPPDYFLRPRRSRPLAVHVLRNVLGGVLVALGLALLVLPGQGVLTILFGLALLDVPFKRRALRRLLCQRNVRSAVQKLRARAGRPPLLVPDRT